MLDRPSVHRAMRWITRAIMPEISQVLAAAAADLPPLVLGRVVKARRRADGLAETAGHLACESGIGSAGAEVFVTSSMPVLYSMIPVVLSLGWPRGFNFDKRGVIRNENSNKRCLSRFRLDRGAKVGYR
jgi:hypothetical protein